MKSAKKFKKVLAKVLAGAMIVGMAQLPVSENFEAKAAEETASVSVYPTPQSIVTNSDGGMKLNGAVDIIVHGEQDAATLSKLEALLEKESYSFSYKDAVGENAAIILAVDCENAGCTICDSVTDSANALAEEQGYVLKASDDNHAKGQVTIIGADADGAYYGVMTLLQMFNQKTADGRIAEVTISDYPDIKFRGYVEGFYGFPWSFEDRKGLFEDTALYKMNTYIYAPKDDPYHRGSWRTLYPTEEANNIKALTEVAKENNMEFCWTIHPGADYNYTSDSDGDGQSNDFETLIAKLEQVYSLGVRQFGIFYDDLDYSVANGNRHAAVINDAYAYLTEKYDDVKPFITVLTRYTNSWGAPMNTYFTPFMQQIHEDTIVLWTGNSTMSAITYEYFEWPQTQTGIDRDFGVWWNYPVNDYCDGHLLMSPLHCLDNDVTNINSFFLNPMSEADASKVAIYSGADYSWNIADFESQSSWERAILELVPEANESFERFADNIGYVNQGSGFIFEESVYLEEELSSFETAVYSGDGLAEEIQNMKQRFAEMVSDAAALKTIKKAGLLEEITVYLDAYKAMGETGVATMNAFEAAMEGDIETCLTNLAQAEELYETISSYKIPVYENGATIQVQAYVGSHRLIPFLDSQIGNVMTVLSDNLAGTQEAEMLTNAETIEAKEVAVSKDKEYSVSDITATMNEGDYVAIALPKAMNIQEISAAVSPADNFKLEYSLNGIEWKSLDAELSEGTLTAATSVMGAYVRLVATKDNTQADIDMLSVSSEGTSTAKPVNPSVSTNMTHYQTNVIANAIDGNYNSRFWSSHGSSEGSYIEVDLGAEVPLNSVEMYSALSKDVVDAFAATQLQVSSNHVEWKNIGEPKPLSDFVDAGNGLYKLVFDAEGTDARYFRFVATSESDSWLMVYEITWDIDNDAPMMSVSTNMGTYMTYTIGKALDNDMSTQYYSNEPANAGDYVQVDLGATTTVNNATIYFGGSPNDEATAIDGFRSTKLQVSADGTTWKDVSDAIAYTDYGYVGEQKYAAAFDVEGGEQARYVRFTATENGTNWVQVYEIKFNDVSYVDGTVSISQSNCLDDGDISTAANIYNVEAGDTLIYPMTTITDVGSIGIYQDSEAISNATVSVQKLDGTWEEIGTLDKVWNKLPVNETILAVQLTFDGTVEPVIYEIVVTEKGETVDPDPTPVVNKEALEAAVDVADAKKEADYTPNSWKAFAEALKAAKEVLAAANATQANVDDAAAALNAASGKLVEKADKTALAEKVKDVSELKEADYTAESWAVLEAAIEAANAVLSDDDATDKDVADALAGVEAAHEGLKVADKPVDPEEPDKPVDPEEPDKPVDPEEPVGPEEPVDPEKPDDSDDVSPETGDYAMPALYMMVMMLCVVGFVSRKKMDEV